MDGFADEPVSTSRGSTAQQRHAKEIYPVHVPLPGQEPWQNQEPLDECAGRPRKLGRRARGRSLLLPARAPPEPTAALVKPILETISSNFGLPPESIWAACAIIQRPRTWAPGRLISRLFLSFFTVTLPTNFVTEPPAHLSKLRRSTLTRCYKMPKGVEGFVRTASLQVKLLSKRKRSGLFAAFPAPVLASWLQSNAQCPGTAAQQVLFRPCLIQFYECSCSVVRV